MLTLEYLACPPNWTLLAIVEDLVISFCHQQPCQITQGWQVSQALYARPERMLYELCRQCKLCYTKLVGDAKSAVQTLQAIQILHCTADSVAWARIAPAAKCAPRVTLCRCDRLCKLEQGLVTLLPRIRF
jgi:hypothetical protein